MKTMLDTTETQEWLADRGLKISQTTLARWRKTRRGPAWVRFEGSIIRYPISGLESWMAEQMDAAGKSAGGDGREDAKRAQGGGEDT